MARVSTDFDFFKFDVGGKSAKAGDKKLTGEEVVRAKRAGYNVWEGYTINDNKPTIDDAKGTPFMFFTRDSALSGSKFCKVGSTVLDIIASPITFPVGFIQALLRNDDK